MQFASNIDVYGSHKITEMTDRIRDMIENGVLKPGRNCLERNLWAFGGLSSVREALHSLSIWPC